MKGIFNGKLIDISGLDFLTTERAFNYGDGLFETIIVENGTIKLLDYHLERLQEGMKVLSLLPDDVSYQTVKREIDDLMSILEIKKNARVKIQMWRQTGGLYIPQTNSANVLITAKENMAKPKTIMNADIATSISLSHSPLSSIKTANALPYILAGIEMKARKLEEIIILDGKGNLSECSSSNLLWLKKGELFTPALAAGCIAGVMRRHILAQAKRAGRRYHEVLEKPAAILQAERVFCCNVTGIRPIAKIGNQHYEAELDTDISDWISQPRIKPPPPL